VTGLDSDDILIKYTYHGDADLTGTVDLDDFNLFLAAYQANGAPLSALTGAISDAGLSGSDQRMMLAAVAAVPEPDALGLLSLASLALLARGRRRVRA
jgi:hypothetical protein